MLIFWLFYNWKMSFLPILIFALGWTPLDTYIPFNTWSAYSKEGAMKVLSYNIMNADFRKDGGKDIIQYISTSGADIVCLQEYPSNSAIADRHLKKIYRYREKIKITKYNYMVCMSKYPIVSHRKIDYPSKYNGSYMFRIKKGKDTLTVINNHLESNKLNSGDKKMYTDMLRMSDEEKIKHDGRHLLGKLGEAAAIRAVQADTIASKIRQWGSRRTIVCGDFNDSPISYTYRVIKENLTDAYREKGRGPGFSYNRHLMYFRIDHILVSRDFDVHQCEVDHSIKASDHYPIWCIIETNNKQ